MKIGFANIATVGAALAVLFSSAPVCADVSGVSLDAVLSDVQTVLVKVRDATKTDSLPELQAVRLDLRASLQRQADGSFKLFVIEAGAKVSDTTIQEIRLELEPPKAADKAQVAASAAPLANAIIEAARSVKSAEKRDPPLHLVKLEAKIEFTVEKGTNAGFTILPISVSIDGQLKNETSQTITLVFADKARK
jgi:hypothetical protein